VLLLLCMKNLFSDQLSMHSMHSMQHMYCSPVRKQALLEKMLCNYKALLRELYG
jgi:hypothetical protein